MKTYAILLLLAVALLSGIQCKKRSSNSEPPSPVDTTKPENPEITKSGQLKIIKNSALANKVNEVQSVLSSDDDAVTGYFYGNYNANGTPDSIKQLLVRQRNNDTTVSMTFDDKLRVDQLSFSIKGVNTNSLITFSYETPGLTKVSLWENRLSTGESKLLAQYDVATTPPNYKFIGKKTYAVFGSGVLGLLTMVFDDDPIVPDKYASSLVTAQAGAVVVNALMITITTVLGCEFGPIGCRIGFLLGGFLALKIPNSNASQISTSPPNTPNIPFKTDNVSLRIISPANGTYFNNFPRTTNVSWSRVKSATSYFFEVGFYLLDIKQYREINAFYTPETSATFDGVGAQPHRFRVTALHGATPIQQTPWTTVYFNQ